MPHSPESLSALAADLHARLDRLVTAARQAGRDEALAQVQALVSGGAPLRRGPGRPRKDASAAAPAAEPAPRSKRKNPWAGLSPEARLARINAIRKGKGLPLKSSL